MAAAAFAALTMLFAAGCGGGGDAEEATPPADAAGACMIGGRIYPDADCSHRETIMPVNGSAS